MGEVLWGWGEDITSVTHLQTTDQIFMGVVGDHYSVADGHQQEELLDTLHVGRDHHLHALQAAQTHVGQLALQCRLQGQVLDNLKTQTSKKTLLLGLKGKRTPEGCFWNHTG